MYWSLIRRNTSLNKIIYESNAFTYGWMKQTITEQRMGEVGPKGDVV